MTPAPPRVRSRNDSAFFWAIEKLCGERPPVDMVRRWFDDPDDHTLATWAKRRLPAGIDPGDLIGCCEGVSEAAREGVEIE